MHRSDQIATRFEAQIDAFADRFGDHEGVDRVAIIRWLEQFDDADLELAVHVLTETRFYNKTNLRTMARQIRDLALEEWDSDPNHVYFVPIGLTPGGGAEFVARALRGLRDPVPQVIQMTDLAKLSPDEVQLAVFVEDIAATGDTLRSWWDVVEPTVRSSAAQFVVAPLVILTEAEVVALSFSDTLSVDTLGIESMYLDSGNHAFSEPEKERILHYCDQTGSEPEYRTGYGSLGLLLSFSHGCPDNSLPILWHENGWRRLFRRRAI